MKKLKENNTSIHITWNNSWRKWNPKRLLSSRCRPAKVSSSDQHPISKKQYRRCSYRYRFGIHAKSARCAAGWRAIHRGAIPVDVCGKKELLDLVCVPLCISQVSATKRRIKASSLSYPRFAISPRYLSNDEAF